MLVTKLPPEMVDIPWEKGNRLGLRPLSGNEEEEAQAGALREIGERFDPETMAVFKSMDIGMSEKVAEAQERKAAEGEDDDPLAGYSKRLVLVGLVSWDGKNYNGEACNEEAKSGMDARTRDFACLEIIKRTKLTMGEGQSFEPGSGQPNGTEAAQSRKPSSASGSRSGTPSS